MRRNKKKGRLRRMWDGFMDFLGDMMDDAEDFWP